jgi:hypothetical protein
MAELQATLEKVNGHEHACQNGLGFDSEAATNGTYNGSMPAFNVPWDSATRAAVEAQIKDPSFRRPTQSKSACNSDRTKQETKNSPHRTTNAHTTKAAKETASNQPGVKYVPQAELDSELAKLEKLSLAASKGDTTALDKLRAALDNCPHIWRRLADLQQLVELKMIALIGNRDPLRSEAFRKRCSELRQHLSDEDSSLATKMAASRVVATWMFTQFLELRVLNSLDEPRVVKQLEHAERRCQIAMRTYLMAKRLDLQTQQAAERNGNKEAKGCLRLTL